jgi:hypothetical protein
MFSSLLILGFLTNVEALGNRPYQTHHPKDVSDYLHCVRFLFFPPNGKAQRWRVEDALH